MIAFGISIFTMLVKNHEDDSEKMEMTIKDEHFADNFKKLVP